MIFAAISAFPSPTAVKHFVFAALTTGKENVMRSGGGFGESANGQDPRRRDFQQRVFREQRANVPVRSEPEQQKIEHG